MNISLRKANVVQANINDAIKSISIETSLELNEFQDVQSALVKANETLFANDGRRQRLLLALYNIRGLVGAANAQSGVDTKLATAAFVDKRVAQLDELAKLSPVTDLAVITGKLEKIKNSKDDSRRSLYGYNDTVSTTVIGQDQIDQIKAEIKNLKKQKQKINDEILELNIKTEIPLSDEVMATLTAEGLV
jgi:ABC-type antimicrobial peptide transport system permease subunit